MVIERRSLCMCVFFAAMLTAASSQAEPAKPYDRGLEWLWANVEGGVQFANLRTFNANLDTLAVGLTPTSGSLLTTPKLAF